MSSFFSLLANKLGPLLAPQSNESIEKRISTVWDNLCSLSMSDNPTTKLEAHSVLVMLLDEMKSAFTEAKIDELISSFTNLGIFSNIVSFGVANTPPQFIDEAIFFFSECTKAPLSRIVINEGYINALNNLLDNAQSSNPKAIPLLVYQLLSYLSTDPDSIPLFVKSEKSSPLFAKAVQLISKHYATLGEFVLQLIASSKNSNDLAVFLIQYSSLIPNFITFTIECLSEYTTDRQKQSFMDYINRSIQYAPQIYIDALTKTFQSDLLEPFVYDVDPKTALKNSIFILISFDSDVLLHDLLTYLVEHIIEFIKSDDKETTILAIRCSTLLLQYTDPIFCDPPQSVRVSLDYMGLLNAEWFVQPDITSQLRHVRKRVTFSLSKLSIMSHTFSWDTQQLLTELQMLLSNLVRNSFRLNLALTEFFAAVATVWGPGSSYYALSQEYQNGLFKTISDLCTLIKRRIGSKPGTVENFRKAYEMIGSSEWTKDMFDTCSEEERFFNNVLLLLEFLKELHATAQTKNLLYQQELVVTQNED